MATIRTAVLLSGGMDSICLTYYLKPTIAYTVNYGQLPAQREIDISRRVCTILSIPHKVIEIDCSTLGTGSLSPNKALDIAPAAEWWPYRNQLLVTLCLMQGIKDNIQELHIASVKSDAFHKDGTANFYSLLNALSTYQEGEISIHCNTLNYYTHELAVRYKVPEELLLLAHSCHLGNTICGHCSGCLKNLRVRQELNIQ